MGRISHSACQFHELVLTRDNKGGLGRDAEGYLLCLDDWTPSIAATLAQDHQLTLTPQHWELIELIREFYRLYGLSPAMRPLLKFASQQLGADKATSIYFLRLFPGSPAKLLAKVAGLPRPENCL